MNLSLFLQGQLSLLHSLFRAALYDDHLSRVSVFKYKKYGSSRCSQS